MRAATADQEEEEEEESFEEGLHDEQDDNTIHHFSHDNNRTTKHRNNSLFAFTFINTNTTDIIMSNSDTETGPTGDWEDWSELHKLKREKLDYSWQDLKTIEGRRREILRRVEQPFWRILRYWEGTCLRVLARDHLVWGCLAIYAVIRCQAHLNGLPEYIRALGNAVRITISFRLCQSCA